MVKLTIKSFSPCSDWYFVFTDTEKKTINYQLAGFAVIDGGETANDEVVGMVSVAGGGRDDKVMPGTCHLVAVPPVTVMNRKANRQKPQTRPVS
jgi:hypothetical protein